MFKEESSLEPMEQRIRESFARQGLMRTMLAEMTSVTSGTTEIRFPYSSSLSQQKDTCMPQP